MQIVSEYIALLQDDVRSEERYRREALLLANRRSIGFVTPEKRSPAIIAGGALQLVLYVYNGVSPYLALARLQASVTTPFSPDMANSLHVDDRFFISCSRHFCPGFLQGQYIGGFSDWYRSCIGEKGIFVREHGGNNYRQHRHLGPVKRDAEKCTTGTTTSCMDSDSPNSQVQLKIVKRTAVHRM